MVQFTTNNQQMKIGGNPQNLKNFPKGVSGNPAGKPKGTRDKWKPLSKDLQEILEDEIDVQARDDKGNILVTKRKFRDQIMRKLAQKASNGDLRAIELILDRLEGKPRQAIEHASDENNPPEFIVKVIKPD